MFKIGSMINCISILSTTSLSALYANIILTSLYDYLLFSIVSWVNPFSENIFLIWMISNLLLEFTLALNKSSYSINWLTVLKIYEPLDRSFNCSSGNFLEANLSILSLILVIVLGLSFTDPKNQIGKMWCCYSGNVPISLYTFSISVSSTLCYLVCCIRSPSTNRSRVTSSFLVKFFSSFSLQNSKSSILP